jgi:hypothetical protein
MGSQCFCGSGLTDVVKEVDEESICYLPCSGDGRQICGEIAAITFCQMDKGSLSVAPQRIRRRH